MKDDGNHMCVDRDLSAVSHKERDAPTIVSTTREMEDWWWCTGAPMPLSMEAQKNSAKVFPDLCTSTSDLCTCPGECATVRCRPKMMLSEVGLSPPTTSRSPAFMKLMKISGKSNMHEMDEGF